MTILARSPAGCAIDPAAALFRCAPSKCWSSPGVRPRTRPQARSATQGTRPNA